MGLVYQNPFGGEWKGKFGDMVFARHAPGVQIGRRRPTRKTPPTEAELLNRAAFRQAVIFANAVWKNNPELKAKYNAAARFGRGFELAKSDYLVRPRIEDIDPSGYLGKAGGIVRISAVDVFELAAVSVKIRDLAGTTLEEGAALFDNGVWVYTAKTEVAAGQTVTLEVSAKDHPGHTATRKADHVCGAAP